MSQPGDSEAYLKGYEDAMRVATRGKEAASTTGTPGTSPSASARTSGRDIGGKVQRGIGTAIGWLILFPLFVGLLAGSIFWLGGHDFANWAVAWGGGAFLFALFAGAVIVGFQLFVRLWPLVIVVVIAAVLVKKLM